MSNLTKNGDSLRETIDGLPNFCGLDDLISNTTKSDQSKHVYTKPDQKAFGGARAVFANILHMHQPLVPAGGDDLKTAKLIGNLQYMMEHQSIGDNHNAPIFLQCYVRMADFIPQLVQAGHSPRIMLDYSGCLLYGLHQMGANDVLDKLRRMTNEYAQNVEWVGTPWGHAVAPSTPVQDFHYHVRAWQHHFATIFGLGALKRVRGFSPSEMALPNDPDVAYEFVKTLKDCGYHWIVVQEHTVETFSGSAITHPHIPHQLVATNSSGQSCSIIAVIKTQGSDTKLVGQMQPYYEAKSLGKVDIKGKNIPPLVTQIADGENGGVMMNEFPPKFMLVMEEASHSDVPPMNVSEYLEHLWSAGVVEDDLPSIRPIMQSRIFAHLPADFGPDDVKKAIAHLKSTEHGFHMEGGSWTSNLSWVRGYEDVLGPMEKLSASFDEKVVKRGFSSAEERYRKALFHLLCSQTSCYRYWGQGMWTDYGLEIIRRADEIIKHDFKDEA